MDGSAWQLEGEKDPNPNHSVHVAVAMAAITTNYRLSKVRCRHLQTSPRQSILHFRTPRCPLLASISIQRFGGTCPLPPTATRDQNRPSLRRDRVMGEE